jgi:hypothetical protein
MAIDPVGSQGGEYTSGGLVGVDVEVGPGLLGRGVAVDDGGSGGDPEGFRVASGEAVDALDVGAADEPPEGWVDGCAATQAPTMITAAVAARRSSRIEGTRRR